MYLKVLLHILLNMITWYKTTVPHVSMWFFVRPEYLIAYSMPFTWQLLNNIYTTTFVCQALHCLFQFSKTYITSQSSSQTCAISRKKFQTLCHTNSGWGALALHLSVSQAVSRETCPSLSPQRLLPPWPLRMPCPAHLRQRILVWIQNSSTALQLHTVPVILEAILWRWNMWADPFRNKSM